MKHKSGLIGFSYLTGLICATFFNSYFVFVAAAVFLVIALIVLFLKKKTAAVVFFTAFTAVSVYGIYTALVYTPIMSYDGKAVEIGGQVSEIRHYSNDTASYIIETEINGVNTSVTLFSADTQCNIGDYVKFEGKLSAMTDNTDFAEESYYKTKGIFLKATATSSIEVIPDDSFNLRELIVEYSDYIGSRIELLLPGEEGDLLRAMFLGDKSGLSDSLSDNIKRAGISHFTAVSGLHLTIISHILMLIISLTPLKKHRVLKFLTLTALILLFMVFFKLSVSVIRAGIMLIVYYGAEPLMRKGSTINSMGLAILALTLFQPYACLDIGLLLSVAGTFGIGVLSPFFCRRLRSNRLKPFKSALVGSVCATVCTFPISCVVFGGFSIVGILMNLILYPLFFPALVFVTLFVFTLGISKGLMFGAGICSKGMAALINLFGSFKYGYISLDYDFIAAICLASAIFVIIIYFCFKDSGRTAMALGLSVCILIGSVTATEIYNSDKPQLLMYSDGDDACVIASDGGNICIIASDDSKDILNYINEYMKNSYLDKISVIRLMDSSHNNIAAFEAISSDYFVSPETYDMEYSLGEAMTLSCYESYCTVKIGNISLTVSPAKEPVDDSICVIYGYKKIIPELSGLLYFSNKRTVYEYGDFTNLYYETAEYLINNGFLQKIS